MSEIVLVRNGEASAAIAVPEEGVERQQAARIQEAIKQATGAELPTIDDSAAAARIGERNLVVIGNLMSNEVAARLYRNYYVASDAAQPGAGHYELRTVHDPEALGIGVVFCGGSDAAGIEASVERLLAHLKPGPDLALPHLVEMQVGKLPAPLTDEQLAAKLAEAKPPYGACDLLIQQGLNYYETNVYDLSGKRVYRVQSPGPGLAIADIDGDGMVEFICGSCKGPISVTSYDPKLEFTDMTHTLPGIWSPKKDWSLDTGAGVDVLRLADLTGDGTAKIVACSRNSLLYVLNPDGTIHWTRGLGDCLRAMEVADLDGDGTPEVLAGNDAGQVFVLSAAGAIIAQARAPGLVEFVAAKDLDGDGALEVVAATDGPTLSAYRWKAAAGARTSQPRAKSSATGT